MITLESGRQRKLLTNFEINIEYYTEPKNSPHLYLYTCPTKEVLQGESLWSMISIDALNVLHTRSIFLAHLSICSG